MAGGTKPLAIRSLNGGGSPPLAVTDTSWRTQALCRGKATRSFDPWDFPSEAIKAPGPAKKICDHCPVQQECLIDALWYGEYGIRAGTTQRQRNALLRPRERSSCPLCGTTLPVAVRGSKVQICPTCGISWRTEKPRREGRVNQYE